MKKIWIGAVIVVLAAILFFKVSPFNKHATFKQLIIDTPQGYSVTYADTRSIVTKDGSKENVTIVALNGGRLTPHLDIYKDEGSSYSKIYSFVPEIPDSEGFFIDLYSVIPIMNNTDPDSTLSGILLSMSKVGADYWGDYPAFIKYSSDKGFSLSDFYDGNLWERPEIKLFMADNKDVEIMNQLNPNEKEKTILTQGAGYEFPNILLQFFADNACHVCEHKTVTLKLPVK